MRTKIILFLASFITIIAMPLAMVACQGPTTDEEAEIVVGGIAPLTGIESMLGAERKWAYEQAVKDINATGGVFVKDLGKKLPLKLIMVDDKSTVPGSSEAAEKLIKVDKVDFLLATEATPNNEAAATVAEKYKQLFIATTFFPEAFLAGNFTWVVDSFFTGYDVCGYGVSVLDSVPQAERPTKWAVISPDIPDGKFVAGLQTEHIQNAGYEVVVSEFFPEGAKDLSAIVTKMKANNADAMDWFGSYADGITLIRQLKESRCNLKYIASMKGMWPAEFAEALGPDADYIVVDGFWSDELGYPMGKELQDRFMKDHNGRTSVSVGNFYSVVQILAAGIEAAGTLDKAKVRDVFYSGTFEAKGTTMGDLKFNERGLNTFSPVGLQWFGGERHLVYPPIGTWKLKLAPPWDQR